MPESNSPSSALSTVTDALPIDRLRQEAGGMLSAIAQKGFESLSERIQGLTDNLNDFADGGGVVAKAAKGGAEAATEGDNPVTGALKGGFSGAKDKVKNALGGGSGGGNAKANRSVNIIEYIDVGVPVSVAYNQWTQFADFPDITRKVESVTADDETTLNWKAKIVWSHRTWKATIKEQVPDERIIWTSEGQKGHVNGAVSFHEIGPQLTRIVLVLEYYPQGLFERTGNIWRAQGRRARSDLRHFARHVMTRSILAEDELEGWRGEIHDSEMVREPGEYDEEFGDDPEGDDPESDVDRENSENDQAPEDDYDEDVPEEDSEDAPEEDSEDAPEEEYDDEEVPEEADDEHADEPEEELPEDEYDAEPPEEAEDVPEDEYDEEDPPEEAEDEYAEEPEDEEELPEDEDDEEEDDESEAPEDGDEESEVAEDEDEDAAPPKRRSRRRRSS